MIVSTLHENQTGLVVRSRMGKFPFGGRNTLGIFIAILITKQADVNVAPRHLVQINLIGAKVRRRHILKQKRLEKPVHQRIVAQPIAQRDTVCGELLLHAADKNT